MRHLLPLFFLFAVLSGLHGFDGTPVRSLPFSEPMRALAASGSTYVAVGAAGAIYSSADGVSWTRRETLSREELTAACWTGSLFLAAGANGTILTSPDGTSWTSQTSGTSTLHFAAAASGNNTLLALGDAGKIYRSTNSGSTWTASALPSPDTDRITSAAYGSSGPFVAVTEEGKIYTSTDAATWTRQTSPASGALSSITYSGSQFVATGAGGEIFTSPDGTSWTSRRTNSFERLHSVAPTTSGFVAAGTSGTVLRSSDGISWASATIATSPRLRSVVSGPSGLLALSDDGRLWSSSDATAWTPLSSGQGANLYAVAAAPSGPFVAVGQTGGILSSSDAGTTWTQRTSPSSSDLEDVAYGAGLFVAVGAAGTILTSPDGINWSAVTSGQTERLTAITYADNKFVAVGKNGISLRSTDGSSWASSPIASSSDDFSGVAFGNGTWVAVGQWGQIATSLDAANWTLVPASPDVKERWFDIAGISFASGKFIAASSYSTCLTSSDGVTWTKWAPAMTPGKDFHGIAALNGQTALLGDDGMIQTSFDGTTWNTITRKSGVRWHDGTYGQGTIVLVGANGAILRTPAPKIDSLSPGTTVLPGNSTILTASASGDTPLSYQWFSGMQGDTTSPISGATSTTYSTPALNASQSYWLRVTGASGNSVSGNTITVTVRGIASHPQTISTPPGTPGTLSVVAGGSGTLTYQWYRGVSGDTSSPISGATASTLTMDPGTSGVSCWVRITDSQGSFDSNAAAILVKQTLWVAYHDSITQADNAANVTTGIPTTASALKNFSTGATLSATVNFAMTIGTSGGLKNDAKTGNPILGGDAASVFGGIIGFGTDVQDLGKKDLEKMGTATVTFEGLTPGKRYELTIFGTRDNFSSQTKILLGGASSFQAAHSSGCLAQGGSPYGAEVSIATGDGSTVAGRVARWLDLVPSSTSITLTITSPDPATNSCILPQAYRLAEITASPVITSNPSPSTVSSGDSVELNPGIAGSPSAYQWYRTDRDGNVSLLPGATNPSLTLTSSDGSGRYSLTLQGANGEISSAPADVIFRKTYSVWATENALSVSSQNEDADGDGIPNLLEFFMGSNPAAPSPEATLSASFDGTTLSFPFRVSKEIEGISFVAECSSNLQTWTTAPSAKTGDIDFLTESWEAEAQPSSPCLFLRIKATAP